MIVLMYTLIVPAGWNSAEVQAAGVSCDLAVTIGIPSVHANRVTEEDLPALVTETIETALGVYVLDFGDGDFFEYTDWYEVSHVYDIEPQIPCAQGE